MSFFECPYCFREAASKWDFGNSAFVLEPNKKCPHCLGPIKMNFPIFFLEIVVIPIPLFILIFYCAYVLSRLFPIIEEYLFFLFFILLGGFLLYLPKMINQYLKLTIFLPKENVQEYRDNIPSYLQYDPSELKGNNKFSLKNVVILICLISLLLFLVNKMI